VTQRLPIAFRVANRHTGNLLVACGKFRPGTGKPDTLVEVFLKIKRKTFDISVKKLYQFKNNPR
jgi:hypothetical protein